MKTKNLTTAAVLLAIGTILHLIVPGFGGGMKPDFIIVTMFFAVLLNLDLLSTIGIGIVAGILGAMTTTFPAGQLPNIIDKLLTSIFVLFLFKIISSKGNISVIKMAVISFIATMFSGFIFLSSALFLSGLPEATSLSSLILVVVVPTAILNGLFSTVIFKAIRIYKKTAI